MATLVYQRVLTFYCNFWVLIRVTLLSRFFLIPWRLEKQPLRLATVFPSTAKLSRKASVFKDSHGDGVKDINQNKNTKNHDRAAHWTLNAANWVLSRARPDNLCAEKPSFLTAMTSPYWQNIWKIHGVESAVLMWKWSQDSPYTLQDFFLHVPPCKKDNHLQKMPWDGIC